MVTMTEKSFRALEYARVFQLFRCSLHLEVATEKKHPSTRAFCDGIIKTGYFCKKKKKKQRFAKRLGRSNGEGETEFSLKSTKVYEICRLQT
ncbi:hypothetical protein TNCV_1460861 [Trichonephila clavipes]|nr:hypothetical protein TNCV_1460861 [Trichonephila clavipes]